MRVPVDRFEEVTAIVNAFPEVAHNYERRHALNMWFVLAVERPEGIEATVARIGAAAGLEVLNLPKLAEYFLELKLTA
jgi:siroheme decarboxylase